ncbi:MAG: flagellar basal body-associated FliL family protein [Planctomycetota bacterium]
MADEPIDNPDAGEEGEDAPKKGGILGMLMKTPVLVGGAMVLEAIALFIGFKMIGGGPDESAAALQAELEHGEVQYDSHGDPIPVDDHGAGDLHGETMLSIAEVRAHNTKSGRDYLYDVTFYAMVDKAESETIQTQITEFQPLIQDRARTIIADMDPAKLSGAEPGLETLRRKMQHEMDEILGKGSVKSIVVPRCVPFRIDF